MRYLGKDWSESLQNIVTIWVMDPDEPLDAGLSAQHLCQLAERRPDLWSAIAGHPNASPELVRWIDSQPAPSQQIRAQPSSVQPTPVQPTVEPQPDPHGRSEHSQASLAADPVDRGQSVGEVFVAGSKEPKHKRSAKKLSVIVASVAGVVVLVAGVSILVVTKLASPSDTPSSSVASASNSISAGGHHSCVLNQRGEVYCWGDNHNGQLGDGSREDRLVPVRVGGALEGHKVTAVSAGLHHTCAVTVDQQAYCWGDGGNGKLGDGSTVERLMPVRVGGALAGHKVTAISAGSYYSCAVTDDRQVYCWGYNDDGKLGDGSTVGRLTPVRVGAELEGRKVTAVSAGESHSCALTNDHQAFCWGFNAGGGLGDGSTVGRLTPVRVGGELEGRKVTAVSAGSYYSCAVTVDHQVYCWGWNEEGQLGDGSTVERLVPVRVGGALEGRKVTAVSAGSYYSCAVTDDHQPFCWGSNKYGGLGDGSTVGRLTPVRVDGELEGREVAAVSVGESHSCALQDDRQVYCWGFNSNGKLGDGSTVDRSTPVRVSGDPGK